MRWLRQSLLVLLLVGTTFIAVGLSAQAGGPLSIAIRPVLWRMDAAAIARSRASALGIEVDVKIWTVRVHVGWSMVPLSWPTASRS